MATYHLGDLGLSPGDPIDPWLKQFADGAADDIIQVPAGTYPVEEGLGVHLERSTVEAVGGRAVFDFGDKHAKHMGWHAADDAAVRNLTFKGTRGGGGGGHAAWADSGADLWFEGCHWPDGSVQTSDAHGVYLRAEGGDREHRGAATFRGCLVEGFSSAGIDAAWASGKVYVEGSALRNNNIAAAILSTDGSYVHNSLVAVSSDYQGAVSGGGHRPRGVWVRGGGAIGVQQCDFPFASAGSPITDHPDASGATVAMNDNRIRQDGSAPAIKMNAASATGGGNHVSGSGNLETLNANHVVACRDSGCTAPSTSAPGYEADTFRPGTPGEPDLGTGPSPPDRDDGSSGGGDDGTNGGDGGSGGGDDGSNGGDGSDGGSDGGDGTDGGSTGPQLPADRRTLAIAGVGALGVAYVVTRD